MNTRRGAFEENILSRMEAANSLASKNIDEIKKQEWNAAIEKVAIHLDEIGEMGTASYIREELKK